MKAAIAFLGLSICLSGRADLATDIAGWNGQYVAFVGDSITEGYPTHHTVLCTVTPGPTGNTDFDVASNLWSYSSQRIIATNYGVQSWKWKDVATNGVPRALASHPRYVFARCGVNDASFSVPWSDVLTNLNLILGQCQASNALLVIQDIMPANTAGDSLAATLRAWNTNFDVWASTTGVLRIRDSTLYATNRTSTGMPDNFKPEMTSDGLHITTNAYQLWSRVAFTNLSAWAPAHRQLQTLRSGSVRSP